MNHDVLEGVMSTPKGGVVLHGEFIVRTKPLRDPERGRRKDVERELPWPERGPGPIEPRRPPPDKPVL